MNAGDTQSAFVLIDQIWRKIAAAPRSAYYSLTYIAYGDTGIYAGFSFLFAVIERACRQSGIDKSIRLVLHNAAVTVPSVVFRIIAITLSGS